MKILKFFFSIVLFSIMMVACEKNSGPLNTDDIDLADDDAVTEAIFDDIFSTADNATQIVETFMTKNPGAKGNVVVVADSCPAVTVEFIDEGHRVVTIDFGDGECDALATLRRGDEEKEITLRFRHRKIR